MKRKLNSATARKSPCKTSESLSDLKKYWTSTMILLKKNYKYIPPLQGRRGSLLYPDNLRDTILILIFFFWLPLYNPSNQKRKERDWKMNSQFNYKAYVRMLTFPLKDMVIFPQRCRSKISYQSNLITSLRTFFICIFSFTI